MVIVDGMLRGGRYRVDLEGFGPATYRHRAGALATGTTIHTSAGWADVVEILPASDGRGVRLRARRALPPSAVRPLCPRY
jgi:hypothetical protein